MSERPKQILKLLFSSSKNVFEVLTVVRCGAAGSVDRALANKGAGNGVQKLRIGLNILILHDLIIPVQKQSLKGTKKYLNL
jgi:hypothetical protein